MSLNPEHTASESQTCWTTDDNDKIVFIANRSHESNLWNGHMSDSELVEVLNDQYKDCTWTFCEKDINPLTDLEYEYYE